VLPKPASAVPANVPSRPSESLVADASAE
jgi:hypothetical protein